MKEQSKIKEYFYLMRINNPIGIFLLFLPCLMSVLLISKTFNFDAVEKLKIIFLFLIGSIVMRSAGCVINDLIDCDIDRQVERTKNRPLAKKSISKRGAIFLLCFLLLIGFFVLIQFNLITIMSGIFALIMVFLYPMMKRVFIYPQIFLGIVFNFGVIMASLAMIEYVPFSVLMLYITSIIWTFVYDTIYAYQDIEDDMKIGIYSTAIELRNNPKKYLGILIYLMIVIMFFVGLIEELSVEFFIFYLLALFSLKYEISKCNFDDQSACLSLFKKNFQIGLMIAISILIG